VCILAYGSIMKMAAEVAAALKEQGRSVSVVSVHTVKPLDTSGIADALARHKQVIVIEEMVPHGGLGSRVKEIAWDRRATCRLDTFSLQDEFHHVYGSHEDLLAAHGLTRAAVLAKTHA